MSDGTTFYSWRGFHNSEAHHWEGGDTVPECYDCETVCYRSMPCLCCEKARAEKAEAALRRVREVCDLWQRRYDSAIRHPADIPAVAITAVLRALEGDVDE